METKPTHKQAFTLIELLVVIAIIAILAAILFPVFAQAKMASKQASSASNEKQLCLASMIYLTDHDDRLFFYASTTVPSKSRTGAIMPDGNSVNPVRWWNAMMPYMKNTGILSAPSDDLPTLSQDPSGNKVIPRSYIATRHAEALSSTEVDQVADTIFLTEKWGRAIDGTPITDSWIEPFNGDFQVDPVSGRMLVAANRYPGGLVSSFMDGHVKVLKPGTINKSPWLTGCVLVHRFPVFPDMCDMSVTGCTNSAPENVCNTFTYP